MSADVKHRGNYELFETTEHHRILMLDAQNKEWFAWVNGQQSPILVKSDSDHKKDHTISKGRFYLIDFKDDPDFQDQPHLFLQQDGKYKEVILPNGLPTSSDDQKRLVDSDETISEDKLKKYVG
jgi:hypothetical protein